VKERLVICNEEDDLHDVITGVVRSGLELTCMMALTFLTEKLLKYFLISRLARPIYRRDRICILTINYAFKLIRIISRDMQMKQVP